MRLLANREIKRLFQAVLAVQAAALLLAEGVLRGMSGRFSLPLLLFGVLAAGGTGAVLLRYFRRQSRRLEQAISQIRAFLDGNSAARLDSDEEGELYRLFHAVNGLTAVLSAHADHEQQEKTFLKSTISDISHQLKTPLAALNIYNALLQDEAQAAPAVREFAALSEQELDRIEMLVQNLLKITRLDADSVALEKREENLAELLRDLALHFAYRAKQEGKTLALSGADEVFLRCDRDWLGEALGNIVKNALDHTERGDSVRIAWKASSGAVQIVIRDTGCGIHPEDLYHIFKRFYRSRYSKDKQGLGLGLPLAKAIIEAHDGTIAVDSEPERGTTFTILFPIPTKL